jgi:hypothetical protein
MFPNVTTLRFILKNSRIVMPDEFRYRFIQDWVVVSKVKFTLEQARVEVYLYSFFNLGARWWWMVNAMPRPLYPRERDPVPIVQEAEWAQGPVWTGAENLTLHRRLDPRTVQPVLIRFVAGDFQDLIVIVTEELLFVVDYCHSGTVLTLLLLQVHCLLLM